MSLQPKSYEEALERVRNRPAKPRKPISRGKGIQRGTASLGRKSGLKAVPTAKGRKSKKPKRPKKKTDGQLKKLVWKEFSIFIRTRDADENGLVTCTTCPTNAHWKLQQAGHFVRGRLNANLFDPRGCHAQCMPCNIYRQGNVVVYYKFMLATYGQSVIDELVEQNNKTHKWEAGQLQGLLDFYRGMNKANPLLAKESELNG